MMTMTMAMIRQQLNTSQITHSVHVQVFMATTVKLCDPNLYTWAISEHFREIGLKLKHYLNSAVYFCYF